MSPRMPNHISSWLAEGTLGSNTMPPRDPNDDDDNEDEEEAEDEDRNEEPAVIREPDE